MTKKEYIQPSFSIIRLQYQQQLLIVSKVKTSGDVNLGYDDDDDGEDPEEGW